MKKRFNDVVTVQYQKCCSDRVEVRDFVNKIRDENPNIVFFRKEERADPTDDQSVLVTIHRGGSTTVILIVSLKRKRVKRKSNIKE